MTEKLTTNKLEGLLTDPQKHIELHRLVHEETEKVYKLVEELTTQTGNVEEVAKAAIKSFEAATENLRLIVAYGCYFGTPEQSYLWKGVLNRLSNLPHSAGSTLLLDLQLYPALLIMYSGGVAASAADSHVSLAAILNARGVSQTKEDFSLPVTANCTMLGAGANRLLEHEEQRKTPLSDHLHELLKETFPPELMFGKRYDEVFDNWEAMVAMYVADTYRDRSGGAWSPVGRFSWRRSQPKQIKLTLEEHGKTWSPLGVGLFGGELQRANEALAAVEQLANRADFF